VFTQIHPAATGAAMRPMIVVTVVVVIIGIPLALGGVVVVAVAATVAGAAAPASGTTCATSPLPPGDTAGAIDTWIRREVPASPLIGVGAEMVAGAAGSGLDPRLLAAMAMQETRLGTAGGGPAVFNPFGLGPGLAFPSWASAIRMAVATLATMHAGGAWTIAGIAVHWAPVGASNDPGGLNVNWVGGVSASYAQLGGDPSGSVFLHDSVRHRAPATACPSVVAPRAS
jgi:hypothetical protein